MTIQVSEKIKEYRRNWRIKNKERIHDVSQIYYQNNKDRILKSNRDYRQKHKKEESEYAKRYFQEHREAIMKYRSIWYENNRQKLSEARRKTNQEMKILVLTHYGNDILKCCLCNEERLSVLSIDHINGGGNKHIKEINRHLYRWLIKNNFPLGFRTLCMNCQFIEREKLRINLG